MRGAMCCGCCYWWAVPKAMPCATHLNIKPRLSSLLMNRCKACAQATNVVRVFPVRVPACSPLILYEKTAPNGRCCLPALARPKIACTEFALSAGTCCYPRNHHFALFRGCLVLCLHLRMGRLWCSSGGITVLF